MERDTPFTQLSSPDTFWAEADKLQNTTLAHAKDLFRFAETASPATLRFLLTQYRYFTIYYIPDLALLIARLDDGRLRSFLSDVLCDELGRGDPELAHPQLYDSFLLSLGVQETDLDAQALESNVRLLDGCRKNLFSPHNSAAYCVGLRGMGGECVCQIYIAQLYEHIKRNPYIQKMDAELDWRFWDLHVGDHDVQHRMMVRSIIDEQIVSTKGSELIDDLGRGFHDSMTAWRNFWENIFRASTIGACKPISRALKFDFSTTAEL